MNPALTDALRRLPRRHFRMATPSGRISSLRAAVRDAGWTAPLAVLAFGVFLLNALVAANALWLLYTGDAVRDDWTSLYAAGTLVRIGDGASLYDAGAQRALHESLYHLGGRTNLFPLPPFAAMFLAPLTRLSFNASFAAWLALNIALLAAIIAAGWRASSRWPSGLRAAFFACAATSAPVVAVLLLSQVDLIVLAAILGCYALLRSDQPLAAGMVLAVGMFKPHIIAPALLLIALHREWRCIAGFAMVALPLAIAPALVYGPGIVVDHAKLLLSFPGYNSELGVNATRMINLRGTVLSIWPDAPPWAWLLPMLALAVPLLWLSIARWRALPITDSAGWAIALVLPLVISPHAHLNSAVLLLAALWLYVDARIGSGREAGVASVLVAYILLTVLWIAALLAVSLMSLFLLATLLVFLRRWPRAAAAHQEAAIELAAA